MLLPGRTFGHMQQKLQALTRQQQISRLRAQMAARNNTPIMLMSEPPGKPGISLLISLVSAGVLTLWSLLHRC